MRTGGHRWTYELKSRQFKSFSLQRLPSKLGARCSAIRAAIVGSGLGFREVAVFMTLTG
jgi:hypothetical protein